MKGHHHAAVSSNDRCWTNCITPKKCAKDPLRQSAHGNIVRTEVCRCGAMREIEINSVCLNYSTWKRVMR